MQVSKTVNRVRYYIGINLSTDRREVFASVRRPTYRTHGARYMATIGPFRNVRAALWTRDHGAARPAYRCGPDLGKTCRGRALPASQRTRVDISPARKLAGSFASDRGHDAIDTILEQVGGVPRKPRDAGGRRDTLGIWAGYAEAVNAGVLKLLPPSPTRPDEIAQVLGVNTAEDAWLALADAARARRGDRGTQRRELQILDRDAASAADFGRSTNCYPGIRRPPVRADELSVGESFTVQGERFTVESIDPDTGDVIVIGGVRFGNQVLNENAVLCPDKGSLVRAAALASAGVDPF